MLLFVLETIHTHTHTVLPHLSIPTRSVHVHTERHGRLRTYVLTPVWSMRELTSIRRVDNGVFIGVYESMVRRYCTSLRQEIGTSSRMIQINGTSWTQVSRDRYRPGLSDTNPSQTLISIEGERLPFQPHNNNLVLP